MQSPYIVKDGTNCIYNIEKKSDKVIKNGSVIFRINKSKPKDVYHFPGPKAGGFSMDSYLDDLVFDGIIVGGDVDTSSRKYMTVMKSGLVMYTKNPQKFETGDFLQLHFDSKATNLEDFKNDLISSQGKLILKKYEKTHTNRTSLSSKAVSRAKFTALIDKFSPHNFTGGGLGAVTLQYVIDLINTTENVDHDPFKNIGRSFFDTFNYESEDNKRIVGKVIFATPKKVIIKFK